MIKVFPKSSIHKSTDIGKNLPKTQLSKGLVTFSFSMFSCRSIKNRGIEFNNCFSNMWEYAEWSLRLLYRLSEFSAHTPIELKTGGESTRCHPVTGRNLQKLKSILMELRGLESNSDDQIMEDGYYELSLGVSEGRIFGYFNDSVYYIALFDPHHLIYADLKHGCQQDLLYKNYDPWSNINIGA